MEKINTRGFDDLLRDALMETARIRAAHVEALCRVALESVGGDIAKIELCETFDGRTAKWFFRQKEKPPEPCELKFFLGSNNG